MSFFKKMRHFPGFVFALLAVATVPFDYFNVFTYNGYISIISLNSTSIQATIRLTETRFTRVIA
jgi:hypothetical protein